MRRALLLLVTASLAACRAPGEVPVPVAARAVRVDAAVAEGFRVPLDERRRLMKRVVLSTGTLTSDGGRSTGHALVRDEAHDAWITEFERELVRCDVQVLDRTAPLDAADAVLHVHLLEVVDAPIDVDLREHRFVRQVARGRHEDVHAHRVSDFVCRVDARLVLKGGLIAWSGEVEVPATSLAAPGSPRLVFHVDALDPVRVQRLDPPTPEAPNPALEVEWAPIVHQLAPAHGLPRELAPTPELVRVVARVAARRCVAELLHAELPPGDAPGE